MNPVLCGGCGRLAMRPMGADVCGNCRQNRSGSLWAHLLMAGVGAFVALVYAAEAGWL